MSLLLECQYISWSDLVFSPWEDQSAKSLFAKENNSAFTYFIDGIPKEVPVRGYISVGSSQMFHKLALC